MNQEQFFSVVALLAVAGTVADFWYGPTMKRRGLFHAALIALYILAAVSVPSCSRGGPDIEIELPY